MAPGPDDAPSRSDFQRLATQMEKLTASIEAWTDRMDRTYLRQDVYARDQRVHEVDHAAMNKNLNMLNSIVKVVAQVVGSAIILGLLGLLFMQGR